METGKPREKAFGKTAKKKPLSIAVLRRSSKIFFFLLLVYGGFLYLPQIDTDLLPFVENADPDLEKVESLDAPQGYTQVLDTYMPFRTCRYVDGNRIFRACSVHYFTEVPAYGVPWYDFIPHFLVIVLLSFLLGRFFCGWVCPLGSVSDGLGAVRKWLRLERLTIPKKIMDFIKKMRTLWLAILFILAVGIAIPFIALSAFKNQLFLIACQTCPARNIFPLISGNAPTWFEFMNPIAIVVAIIGIIFLLMVLLGFFGKKIWCRFCPNGIMLSWFNKGCLVEKEKDVQKCTKCGICKRVCPVDNESVYEEKVKKNVNSQNCIMCFNCVEKCPEEGCLKVKFAGKEVFSSKYKEVGDADNKGKKELDKFVGEKEKKEKDNIGQNSLARA